MGLEGRAGGGGVSAERPRRYGASAPVGSLPWVAVATALDPAASASMWGVLSSYWLVILGVVASTALTYIVVGRVTSSLEALTQAAERVGGGNLRPWLPPPGSDEVGRLTLAFSLMMSRLRDTMEQADRSGRLAVVGKLSSYLAHEIRNPLSAVKMNLQRLERWTRSGEIPERCREPVELSLTEVDRLSTAVSNVLQLSRSHTQPPEVMSVHELVKEAGSLLDTQFLRQGVALRWELDAEADRIVGRRGQLKGVILNLMLNALDAQPKGGELLIRSNLAARVPGGDGPRLELRFLDKGPGVPQGIRDRVFEPFFTTKRTGSGIGLAIASRAVRDHGGDLRLDDPVGVGDGAEFVVSLPLAAVAPEGGVALSTPRLASWMEDAAPGASRFIGDRVTVD
jgi:signal transduction histidine kinase